MGSEGCCEAFIDGASSGNPGPAAYGYVIRAREVVFKGCGYLGRATNNFAEYQALLHCMRRAQKIGCQRLVIHSDSELLVKQMLGLYKVKDPELQRLRERAEGLAHRFQHFEIKHVPRELNTEANHLARKALVYAVEKERRRRVK